MPSRDQILAAIRSNPRLPAPPQILFRILEATRDETTNLNQLAELIRQDSGLSAGLLRQANSALYGFSAPTSSISTACMRLGIKQVRAAVMNQHIVNGLSSTRPPGFEPGRHWQSALATSVAAQEICRKVLPKMTEDASTAGLLCDIGIGLMAYGVPKDYQRVLDEWKKQPDSELDRIENRVLGVSHAEVGATILTEWKLDEAFRDAVRWHHVDPIAPPPGGIAPFTRAVAGAVLVGRIALDGSDMDRLTLLFAMLEGLTPNPDALVTHLLDQLVARIQETAKAFQVELGNIEKLQANVSSVEASLPDLSAKMTSRPMARDGGW